MQPYGFKPVTVCAKACNPMCARLLVADPAKRLTMPELLEHAWVKVGPLAH